MDYDVELFFSLLYAHAHLDTFVLLSVYISLSRLPQAFTKFVYYCLVPSVVPTFHIALIVL